ncbi:MULTISPECIES: hypothetical protein [Brevibacillus]|jgi:hypothetical protein|uniref:hypothetical protein n=1 Tax=Brevibacillus TaxID=55080 RepID=UPI002456504A|nr:MULTISPECIES: hypothetical protein [Brevibacillus]MDH4619968.1 hypothetical protein [Brevibacillus sp. AY1]MED1951828.1 hypothetical protein [Brevibacillus centrosporus]
MKTEINQALEQMKQINVELKENNIRLQNLAEKMRIVIDEQQIMNVDMKEINGRLDALIERYEEREQRQLKAVQ